MTINVTAVGTAGFSGARNATSSGGTTAATGSTFGILAIDDGTGRTPTDNKGNSPYVQVGVPFAGFANAAFYLFENGVGGAGHTANLVTTGGSPDCEVALLEFTGQSLSSIVDAIASAQWKDVSGTPGGPFTSNSLTSANANDLLLALTVTFSTGGTEALTWGGGYVQVEADGSSAQFSHGVAKLVVSATGTYSVSFTSAGAGTAQAVTTLIALKQAGAAAAPFTPFTQNQFFVNDVQIQT